MSVVRTDLRNTRESAKRIRFERAGGLQATNVQDAIEEVVTSPETISPTPVVGTPYNVQNTDTLLWVDTSIGAVTINLPDATTRAGRPLQIKDRAGQAAANPISLVAIAAATIDGLDPYLIDVNYGGVTLYPVAATGDWTTQP